MGNPNSNQSVETGQEQHMVSGGSLQKICTDGTVFPNTRILHKRIKRAPTAYSGAPV